MTGKHVMKCILLLMLTLKQTYAFSDDYYFSGQDLDILCAGFASDFTMADFRRFKCEAYLMGYLDRATENRQQTATDPQYCEKDEKRVARLAGKIIEYLSANPEMLDRPAPEVIAQVSAGESICSVTGE